MLDEDVTLVTTIWLSYSLKSVLEHHAAFGSQESLDLNTEETSSNPNVPS